MCCGCDLALLHRSSCVAVISSSNVVVIELFIAVSGANMDSFDIEIGIPLD